MRNNGNIDVAGSRMLLTGNMKNTLRLLIILLINIQVSQVNAMGFLDFMRIYIFSEVDGVVLLEGKPVSSATVMRTADYKDKLYSEFGTICCN